MKEKFNPLTTAHFSLPIESFLKVPPILVGRNDGDRGIMGAIGSKSVLFIVPFPLFIEE
jgi:hypothetical protein